MTSQITPVVCGLNLSPLVFNLRAGPKWFDFLDYENPTSLFKGRLSQPGVVIALCHFVSPLAVVRLLVFEGRYV